MDQQYSEIINGLTEAYNPKTVIDTTGAGNLFAAGYLHGTCLNLDAENCSKIGSIVASEIISRCQTNPKFKKFD